MKSRFALVAMMALCAAPLAAQGGGGGMGGMGGMRMARGIMNVDTMAVVLGLDAATKAKYQGIVDDYSKSNMSLMMYMRAQRQASADVSPDSSKKQTDMRTKVNADLRALLNAPQQTKFDSIVAATPMGRGRRGGGGGGF